jgi:hypothetical protein
VRSLVIDWSVEHTWVGRFYIEVLFLHYMWRCELFGLVSRLRLWLNLLYAFNKETDLTTLTPMHALKSYTRVYSV